MNRRPLSLWSAIMVIVLTGALLLTACGGEPTPTLVPLPTATPTPRSTPLPTVPSPVPPAAEDNPLPVLFLPQDAGAGPEAAEALTARILELTGLVVDAQLANSYGEIVAALCGANPVAGWVDGLAYMIAAARGCADPALLVERDGESGFQVDLLVRADVQSLTELADLTQPIVEEEEAEASEEDEETPASGAFCRINAEDRVSWLLPSLMLYAANMDPVADLGVIVDVEDYDAIIEGLYNGDCVAGAVPHGYLASDDLAESLADLDDLGDQVNVLQISPLIPYDILVYPQTVPLVVRIPLTDLFVQLAVGEEDAALLADLLGQDSLARVNTDTFANLSDFIDRTGLDLAALGQ